MKLEFNALLKYKTQVLKSPSSNRTAICSKKIFRVKKLPSSLLDKHKSHIVAQGYKKVPSFNFLGTFILVVKQVIIRIILTIVLSQEDENASIRHL